MKVILLYTDQLFVTPVNWNPVNGISSTCRSVTSVISPIFTGVDQPIETLLQSLLIAKAKSCSDNETFWSITVDLGITDVHVAPDIYGGAVKVQDVKTGGILETLNEFFGGRLQLKVDLLNVTLSHNGAVYGKININTGERSLTRSTGSGSSNVVCFNESDIIIYQRESLCQCWREGTWAFKGMIVVTAIVPDNVILTEDRTVSDKMRITRKILQEEIGWDLTIIPGSGETIKCHKSFLIAHSSVFKSMFQGDTKESQTSTIEIPDMTEESFRAFLAFLYSWDVEQPCQNSVICFDLFCAAHKYDVGKLEKRMVDIILTKEEDWFDVDMAMKLFLFTRNIEERCDLKMKAIRILKSKFSTLQTSPSYQELFRKDPHGAMDLCQYSFSL